MHTFDTIVSFNIKKYLKRYNKSRLDLANYLGIDLSLLNIKLSGRQIFTINELEKISKFLNCNKNDLFEDSNEVKTDDELFLEYVKNEVNSGTFERIKLILKLCEITSDQIFSEQEM